MGRDGALCLFPMRRPACAVRADTCPCDLLACVFCALLLRVLPISLPWVGSVNARLSARSLGLCVSLCSRYELVRVGYQMLVGEIIKLEGDTASIQVRLTKKRKRSLPLV